MVELADTQDLGSCAERHTGSTPVGGTNHRHTVICIIPLFYNLRNRVALKNCTLHSRKPTVNCPNWRVVRSYDLK